VKYFARLKYCCTFVQDLTTNLTARQPPNKNKELRKMTTLNPYKITWAVITPVKGKITMKDLKAMKKSGLFHFFPSYKTKNESSLFFASKGIAIDMISKVAGLSKQYKVVYITDKQFGLANPNESLLTVATKKQLIEMQII